MPKRRQLRSFDLKQIETFEHLIGVDEAGRGALAGPVVAGAVLVNRAFLEGRWATIKGGKVNDSKLLSAADREELWAEFETLVAQGMIHAHFGIATVEEIEERNILGATKVLIDGLPLRSFAYPHLAIVNGDARSLCVAMASIVAKVTRDRLMTELETQWPGYGFAQHKGYGTDEHRAAVLRLGRTRIHREMFLRNLLAGQVDPAQTDFLESDEPPVAERKPAARPTASESSVRTLF